MNNLGLLPEGWAKTKVGGYLHLKNGFAFKSAWYTKKDESTVPVIRISNINGKHASESKAVHVSSDNAAEGFEINNGDLLIAMSGATTGKVGIYSSNTLAYQNQRVGNFKLNSEANGNASYRNYLISNLTPDILKIAYGGAQPNISGKAIEEMDINLPPLAEQKVIANKLNELLTQVESTKARLDAIPAILKSFRQSVLAAAVSGKLTEEWRGNDEYTSNQYQDSWGWSGVPSSWNVDLYNDLTDSRLGKMLDKSKNIGLPTNYLGNINVRWFNFKLDSLQEILVTEKELLDLTVQYNDVLICEGGEPGRCAIWKSKSNESIVYQKALHRARVSNQILPEWLTYNLKNDADSLKLNQLFTGTTIKHLTGKALKRYPIRVPNIKEQSEIVRRVEALFAFADKVEAQVNAAQVRVNKLSQSILAKAFRGELTADWRAANPSLITGDNSAAALLERIKAEREALALAVKAAKKPAKKPRVKKAKA